jgi:RHS repeat-associated protein
MEGAVTRTPLVSRILPLAFACIATASLAAQPPPLSSPDAGPEAPLGPEFLGAVSGSGTVSAGGNAVYSVPIEVPPGTAGMQPDLAITYNSNMPNRLMGYGWFVQGFDSNISRCEQTLSQDGQIRSVNHTSRDRFCLDGQRLVATQGAYGDSGTEYKTEVDSFVRVTSHGSVGGGPSYFTVEHPNGQTSYYGNTVDSKIEAQGKSVVRVWALNRVVDVSGNYMDYTYTEIPQSGEYRPSEIRYTGNENNGLPPNARVVVNYRADAPEIRVRYIAGSKITDSSSTVSGITLWLNNEPIWFYRADYEEFGINNPTNPTGNYSRLKAITRCETPLGDGGDCQQPITIDWWAQTNGTPISQHSLTVPSSSDAKQENTLPRWHDLNGDGKADYVHAVQQTGSHSSNWLFSGTYEVMLSGPSGYTNETWSTSPEIPPHQLVNAISWADIDGDGRTDMVTAWKNSTQTDLKIAFSTDSGFEVKTWRGYYNFTDVSYVFANHYLYDMNGDKLLDLVVRKHDRRTEAQWIDCNNTITQRRKNIYSIQVGLNTGSGFGTLQTWISNVQNNADLADMNGDGLMDLVSSATNVHYNNGRGFDPLVTFNPGAPLNCSGGWSYTGYSFYDFNGDGLTDRLTSGAVHLNTGTGFSVAGPPAMVPLYDFIGDGGRHWLSRTMSINQYSYQNSYTQLYMLFNLDQYGGQSKRSDPLEGANRLFTFLQAADLDGDGIFELTGKDNVACVDGSGLNDWCETGEIRYWKSDNPPHHLVRKITSGLGVVTRFTYKPLSDDSIYTKGNEAILPIEDVQDGTHVVTAFSQSDGIGGNTTIKYFYEGLQLDHGGRGSLGFAKITARNLTTDSTVITEYAQAFPYSSQPKRVEVRRTSDNLLLSSVDTAYDVHTDPLTGSMFPYASSTVETEYSLESGMKLGETTTTNIVDDYGNITESTVELHDFGGLSYHKKEVVSSYTHDIANWRVKQLDSVTEAYWLNGSPDASHDRHQNFIYYPANGLLHKTIREQGGGDSLELTTTLVYDQWGNLTMQSLSGPGIATRTETTIYDSERGQFPVTSKNALNHTVTRDWNAKFGTVRSQKDANNQTTSWKYDKFGWRWQETRPDNTVTQTKRYLDNSGGRPFSSMYIETTTPGSPIVREFLDALGRQVSTRTQAFDGRYVNVDTEYDARGRVLRTSEPYFDNAAVHWNTNAYDHLDRVELYTAADPSQSWERAYSGRLLTTTDAGFEVSTQLVNALGQVVWAQDKAGTQTLFIYDAAGNRRQVINDYSGELENSVAFTYDRLGRQLTQNDPDHGIYTRTYDALGQLKTEQSPKMSASAQKVEFSYDLLGRIKTRKEPEGSTTWAYDDTTGGNLGVGSVHSESQFGFTKTYQYAPANFGRLTGTATSIDGANYYSSVTYNAHGKVSTQTYPSGYKIESIYNARGYLERLQEPGGAKVLYQLLETDALGRRKREWLGDGSFESFSYEGQSSRITDQSAVNASSEVQHFSYTYNNIGSMETRSDLVHGLSETFGYDSMDRLTAASVAGGAAKSYDFNTIGNMTRKSDRGNPMDYNSPAIHAVTRITNGTAVATLNYDANGNLTHGNDVPTIAWSSYNKPTRLVRGSVSYSFDYGPDRSRFRRTKGTQVTHYIGDGYEKVIDGAGWGERHYIKVNGRAIMLRSTLMGTGVNQYLHSDHLGSITALTAESGAVISRFSYDAWGKRRHATNWTSAAPSNIAIRGYSGHEHLDDIGVIHMNGRIYDPGLGRMLSPDPVTQAPENGQNYNRYSYAFNNPLKYVDQNGHEVVVSYTASVVVNSAVTFGLQKIFGGLWGGDKCGAQCQLENARALKLYWDGVNWCRNVSPTCVRSTAPVRSDGGHRSERSAIYDLIRQNRAAALYKEWLTSLSGDRNTQAGDPVASERPPGTIYLTGHRYAEAGPYHTAIEYDAGNGKGAVWISAGPQGFSSEGIELLVAAWDNGKLNTRPTDEPDKNVLLGVITPAKGMSAGIYFMHLLNAVNLYMQGSPVEYDAIPEYADGYNSNSFTSGILKASGGTSSLAMSLFVGGSKPVPAAEFGY